MATLRETSRTSMEATSRLRVMSPHVRPEKDTRHVFSTDSDAGREQPSSQAVPLVGLLLLVFDTASHYAALSL